MLLYAITDSRRWSSDFATRGRSLTEACRRWVEDGVEFIQLREKDLNAGELLRLAEDILSIVRDSGTRLLINARADVAVAAGAGGVHLTSHPDELTPSQVKQVFASVELPRPVVSASCHSMADVERARSLQADLILFGPVFEKVVGGRQVSPGTGLNMLKEACDVSGNVPVLALGGITLSNAEDCLQMGAKGSAGIRLFD